MRRVLLLGLVVATAGCTDDEPPPEPRHHAECLPVLVRCGDCLDDCMRPVITSSGTLMREEDLSDPAGQMGRDESRSYARVEHCVDDDCRPVYVRSLGPGGTLNCYGVCAGPTHFPDCALETGECKTRWVPTPASSTEAP